MIEATLSLLREGESAPSLRQAARRAGVSPGAPEHHFKSRQWLMVAVAQEGFQALTSGRSKRRRPMRVSRAPA
ncbi:MAG: hypothetical protein AAFU79_21820 [Myxococcota bacterium]